MNKRLSEQRAREVTRELLSFRGWNLRPPMSGGQVLQEGECKYYPTLAKLFEGKSKSGGPGSGKPDFLLLESAESLKPLVVIDTKSSASLLKEGMRDAVCYGQACADAGLEVLAVTVAGAEKEICAVQVQRKTNGAWKDLTLHGGCVPNSVEK